MSEELTDQQMDALIDGTAEAGTGEIQTETQQTQAQAEPEKYEFKAAGKQVQGTIDQLKQWASQGYHYAQQMNQIKQTQDRLQPYMELDKYAAENKDWWDFVQDQWNNRQGWNPNQQQAQQQQTQPGAEQSPEIQALKQELEDLKKFKNDLVQKQENERIAKEDAELDEKIQSMRENYSHLDWQGIDDDGLDLESRIIAYANKRGISDFEDAFKAYNFESLMEQQKAASKEQTVKDIQNQRKLGILGKTQVPSQGLTDATNLRNKSYGDLVQEALEEIGSVG